MSAKSHSIAALTGAGGGLGRATALRLARRGVAMACSDVDVDGVQETVEGIRRESGRALASTVDITDESAVEDWHQEIVAELGIPTTVLNVAGVLDRRSMSDLPHDAFVRSLEVNVGGAYLVTRTFAECLRSTGAGRVVNVASIAASTGYPYPAYAASKAALLNLTRTLLLDFWGSGVTVNAVSPGAIDTPMLKRDAIASMEARTPLGRIATADDVAGVVDFLCSAGAACINGANIVVDGGATAVFRYFED